MSVINASAPIAVTDRNEQVAVAQYIADVLRRAHETAETVNDPDEARAILNVAEMFAQELADADPRFDRLQFMQAITREPA